MGFKIGYCVICLTGTMASWLVLYALGLTARTFWNPMAYATFLTILEGAVVLGTCILTGWGRKRELNNALGMVWDMDPLQMPKAFCLGTLKLASGFRPFPDA